MQKFNVQIVPPEKSPTVENSIDVGPETTNEEVVEECKNITIANVETILANAVNIIGERIDSLGLVDPDTFVHRIERLKAELQQLYQQVKFASYDVQYGFADQKDHVDSLISFNGNEFATLTRLESVTCILKNADLALQKSHNAMQDLERIIEEAKKRLADLDQENNSKKEKATHAGTISSRGDKLKGKKIKHKALVMQIKSLLSVDPKDYDALEKESENLLKFLLENNWFSNDDDIRETMHPEDFDQLLPIKKNIEKSEELSIQEPRTDTASIKNKPKPTRSRLKNGLLIFACILAGGYYVGKTNKVPLQPEGHHPMHETDQEYVFKNGAKVQYKTLCISNALGLNDKQYAQRRVLNMRRELVAIFGAPHPFYDKDIEKINSVNKAKKVFYESVNGKPINRTVRLTNFQQKILSKKYISDLPTGKAYNMTVKRSGILIVTLDGAFNKTYEVPIEAIASYVAKFPKPKK